MTDIFEQLHIINDQINAGEIEEARNQVIQTLAEIDAKGIEFPAPLNHFIRSVGLYPYLQLDSASWQERFIHESFKVDVGDQMITLHREQSQLLKMLLDGSNIAVSAPTSFGKSFVIDSFIAIRKPKNVVIIVPTIALTDETRRRIQRKFGSSYKIITTTDVDLAEKNILIFPQERAVSYLNTLKEIDILIVDEFYKASKAHDKERSPSLLRAILKLTKISKQRYFLAPNIKQLKESVFTKDMQFINLNFNTVFLEKHNVYEELNSESYTKSDALLKIIREKKGKSLIYAGTYSSIADVSNLIIDSIPLSSSPLLEQFSLWLTKNYHRNWQLTSLVKRGFGVHNGRLHRSLSQLQIKLFEEPNGLDRIVSTSSIIEGVNTSAENVILWRNKSGSSNLKDFTYKNIIGRSGRMFRYFVGHVYLLEKPPKEEDSQLDLEFSDELAVSIDENEFKYELSPEQIAKIIAYKEEMLDILGQESFSRLQQENAFEDSDSSIVLKVSRALYENPENFSGLNYLNSKNPSKWERSLYSILNIDRGYIGTGLTKFVQFLMCISKNWRVTFQELLNELDQFNIGIDEFFDLERKASFNFSSLLNEVNVIQKELYPEKNIDISPFIVKVSHAFLPPNVYKLEEYGLPRMISKKIHLAGVIELENEENSIHDVINNFNDIGLNKLIESISTLDDFDKYILKHFYEGITVLKHNNPNNRL